MQIENKEKLKNDIKPRLMCIGIGAIGILEEFIDKDNENFKKMRGKILDLMNYQIKLLGTQIDKYNTKESVTLIGIIKENKEK